ncbi:hypothetical protein DIPPA_27081 [Diplonema papillatum]|nr:hypothetical protein DIPPA_27081 [Diplonema papillatum]
MEKRKAEPKSPPQQRRHRRSKQIALTWCGFFRKQLKTKVERHRSANPGFECEDEEATIDLGSFTEDNTTPSPKRRKKAAIAQPIEPDEQSKAKRSTKRAPERDDQDELRRRKHDTSREKR